MYWRKTCGRQLACRERYETLALQSDQGYVSLFTCTNQKEAFTMRKLCLSRMPTGHVNHPRDAILRCALCGLESVRHVLRLECISPALQFSLRGNGARVIVRRRNFLVGRAALVQLHRYGEGCAWPSRAAINTHSTAAAGYSR